MFCGLQLPHHLKLVVHAKNVKRRHRSMLCKMISLHFFLFHSTMSPTISQSDLMAAVERCCAMYSYIQLDWERENSVTDPLLSMHSLPVVRARIGLDPRFFSTTIMMGDPNWQAQPSPSGNLHFGTERNVRRFHHLWLFLRINLTAYLHCIDICVNCDIFTHRNARQQVFDSAEVDYCNKK